jgi:hypothetical protein
MGPRTQGVLGYYVWAVPGHPVAVHLRLDVVDRLAAEFLRGLGAVPKRGAEVGGVLLGSIEPGLVKDTSIVRIEDFEPVPCSYVRGPSYLLTDDDRKLFDEICERRSPVGYYRSHTREGLSLGPEDLDLALNVALLVKPLADKPGVAGFFIRENGVFPGKTPLEFPFRRWEMTGEEPPPPPPSAPVKPAPEIVVPPPQQIAEPLRLDVPPRPKSRTGIWMVAAFVFLLLGVLLGYQASLITTPRRASDFAVSLAVERNGDNLMVRWNREAPAVRSANSGLLEIDDGGETKRMELDRANLSGGNFIYRKASEKVRFRLVIYLDPGVSVTEELDWPR